jgi:uncharacterized protein
MKRTVYLAFIFSFFTLLHLPILCIQSLAVTTIYGDFIVTEPVLIELFKHPIMERIKHVRQYGISDYIIKQKFSYTRYEHCVGVWALLRRYGASLEEQIAGLLHDASHTVFSHVGDTLFQHTCADSSYQDDIHEWYLQHYQIDDVLTQFHIPLQNVLAKNGTHLMLEQDLPNICADRLEYNLQAGLLTDMLTIQDIDLILKDLEYENGHWFFTDKQIAKKLAVVSLYNTEHVWGTPTDKFIYTITAQALERALEINLLTLDDIHFSTDAAVWDKLWISNDPYIMKCLEKIVNYKSEFIIIRSPHYQTFTTKFRGLDPWIKYNNTLQRLTQLDIEYQQEYNRVHNQVTQGWKIEII